MQLQGRAACAAPYVGQKGCICASRRHVLHLMRLSGPAHVQRPAHAGQDAGQASHHHRASSFISAHQPLQCQGSYSIHSIVVGSQWVANR